MSLWLSKSVVAAVADALGTASGQVAILGLPRMHKALAASRPDIRRLDIASWAPEVAGLGALVVGDVRDAEWQAQAESWHTSLVSSGILLAVGKGRPSEVSRRFLCAGFSDLWQVKVGRTLVTAGRRGPHLA